ncbi:PEP/pyruvate-binding domain-containing protein [Ferrovum myxofaciens]|uniref:PEP/pyruvate-binding domain-containing protein n=1 Tax=Ferrovum myxofaciens TaxID=416213 RepID=UPI0030811305
MESGPTPPLRFCDSQGGGVITAGLYRIIAGSENIHNLIGRIDALPTNELMATENPLLTKLHAAIVATPLPVIFEQTLTEFLDREQLADRPVAVRSSATQEDSGEASFAGIHDTTLNIHGHDDIEQAILRCFASLWSSRAIAYRRKMKISSYQIACAVVITEMVNAESAGIAFSCDPVNGRHDVITINANYGLGESVVSGTVEPDQYRLNRFSKTEIDSQIGQKQQRCQAKPGGGIEWVKNTDSHQACLNECQIQLLARICDRVFHALGRGEQHQDIEWAFDGNGFILLQARPVTALPKITCAEIRNQPEIWSNGNFRDAVPMVMSRLVSEFSDHQINNILHRNFDGFYPIDPALRFARQFQGRFYCNVSLMQWLWFDSVEFPPDKMNISMGGHQPLLRIDEEYKKGLGRKMRRIWRGLKFFRMIGRYRKQADAIIKSETEFAEQYRQLDYHALSDQELVDTLQLLNNHLTDYNRAFIMLTSQSGVLFMLIQTLEKYLGERAYAIANTLMTGCADITSANHGYQLQSLAQQLKNDPQALQIINGREFQSREWRAQLPEHSPFKKAFANYLTQYGHRAVYEIDMSRPRWREEPGYLFNCIKGYLALPEIQSNAAIRTQENENVWREIRQHVPFYLQGYIRTQVATAAHGSELKELSKSTFVRLMEPMRQAFVEMGLRLAQRNILESEGDIFHCALCEIVAVLQHEWDGKCLKMLIAERKAIKAVQEQLPPPDIIIDDAPQYMVSQPTCGATGLRGVGVAKGVASGIARLIRTPEEGHRLQGGDILVAPSTDPAWTPLFLNAAAIVMETGGYLSHGSIVAREYGIPAVVNIPGIFSLIKNGDSLKVNGNQGMVEVMMS